MKAYYSIEELAEDIGISERQGWRWLKAGKIKKKKSEDGRIIFILVDEPTDITDTDFTDNVTTDVSDMSSGDSEPISNRRVLAGKKQVSVRGGSGLVQGLRDELEASRVQFEIEKLTDLKQKWQERQDRERKEKVEAERVKRLDEFLVRESQEQTAETEAKARAIIQKVKNEVLPVEMKDMIPVHIMAYMYQEIEKVLSKMDVLTLPFHELTIIAEGIKDRLIEQFSEELRPAIHDYFITLARQQLNESWRLLYHSYRERGGTLPYRNFILSLISKYPIEKQRQFLQVVDV